MINDNYNDNLHKGATGKLYEYGKDLRQTSTKAEEVLWQHLRNKKLNGLKFRRQHPLDNFIADFYCNEKKLVIELDGGIHDEKEIRQYDEARTYDLKEFDITVIRFRNEEVLNDIKYVIEKIKRISESRNNLT
ncbi:MAG TPA: endonuclease domain-containing protein [Chitinophagaceae bacterium]|nr:endonuclease domain-containing protein [Chitinophagaceae bacterium]